MSDDLAPRLKEMLEGLASQSNVSVDVARSSIERNVGIDLSEVSDEDAEEFADALENDEIEKAIGILEDYGADEQGIELFRSQLEAAAGGGGSGNSESGESSDSDSSDLSEEELDARIQQHVPSAEEIASELKTQLGGGGGGAGGTPGRERPTQEQSPQEQQGNQMGQLLSLVQLMNQGGGGSAVSEKAQEATEKAMEQKMMQMAKPSFGEMIGHQIEQQAAEQIASEYTEGINLDFGGGESDDEDDAGPFEDFE